MQKFEFMTNETVNHLKLLGKGDLIAFQTFDDSPERKQGLTKQLFGTFEDHKTELERLNNLGAGVFVMVNDTQTLSTKAEAITAIRAFFTDSDNGSVTNIPLEPSFEVKTAHGYHYYWLHDKLDLIEDFELIENGIIAYLQTDPAVKNRNRLLRLAGFYHQKDPNKPVLVTVGKISGKKYSANEMRKAFNCKNQSIPNSPPIEGKWEMGTRNSSLYKYVKQNEMILPPDASSDDYFSYAMEANNKFCTVPLDEVEVKLLANSAFKTFQTFVSDLERIAPTLAQLEKIAFPPKIPLVENLIFKRQISIIGARPKVGKSTLIRYMCKCLVDGEDFLGRASYGGKVLYLALEELLEDATQDFKDMNVKNTDNIRITTLSNCESSQEYIEHFIKLAKTFKPDLIVIDTMIHLLGVKDISDYGETSIALKTFRNFAMNNNCHIIFIHHNRKGDSNGNDSLLGSTGIAGAVDIIFDMKKSETGSRFFCSEGRSSQKHIEKIALIYNTENKSFAFDPTSPSENVKECVLNAIRNNKFSSIEKIRAVVGGKGSKIQKIVDELLSENKIQKKAKIYKVVESTEVENELF